MKWAKHVARLKKVYKILVGKSKMKA